MRAIAVLVSLAAGGPAAAGGAAPLHPPAEAPRTEPDTGVGTLSELEHKAVRHLFNYDFEDAARLYQRISEALPDRPIGPYNLAAVIWTRLAQRSGGMRGSTHQGDRYWTQSRKPETSEEETERFRAHLAESLARSRAALERNPADLDALYYRGATHAMESGWKIVVERSYVGGYRAIRRAVNTHRELLAMDFDFADAHVVPGAYSYGVATLPRALRIIGRLFGVRGDLEEGIAGVRRTAAEGVRARWGALWTLALLMQREGRHEEALPPTLRLREEFPKNPDYALEVPAIRLALGEYAEARAGIEEFLVRRGEGYRNYQLAAPGIAELRLGESWLFEEEWTRAEAALSRGLAAEPESEVAAMLHFRRANARDGAGRRQEAIVDYLEVRRNGSDEVLSDWAGRLLSARWPEGAPEGSAPR